MPDSSIAGNFRNILVCYHESAVERSLAVDEEAFRSGISELLRKDVKITFTKSQELPSRTVNYELLLLVESFSGNEVAAYLEHYPGRTVFYSLCSQDRFFERVRFLKENNISLLLVSQKRYLQKFHLMDIHGRYLPLLLPPEKILSSVSAGTGLRLSGPSRKYSSSDDDLRDFSHLFFERQPDDCFDRRVYEDRISEWDLVPSSGPGKAGIDGLIKVYEDEDLEIDVLQALKAGFPVFAGKRFARLFSGIIDTGNWMVFENLGHLEQHVRDLQGWNNQELGKMRVNNELLFRSNAFLTTGDTLRYLMFDCPGHYNNVINSLSKNNVPGAFAYCVEILNHHPDDLYALYIMGKISLDLNIHTDAEYLFRKSFDLDQGNPEVIYALATIYKNSSAENYRYFYTMLCNFCLSCSILSQSYAGIHNVPHIEIQRLEPYCKGQGLDIGCGSRKTFADSIGIDLIPRGKEGQYGQEKWLISDADICADGAHLPCKDNSVDYLVAKHNFEHFADPATVLKEWIRVVKPGGIVGIVVPDDCFGNSVALDPTHKQAFTLDGLRGLAGQFDDVSVLASGQGVPNWSIYCILEKKRK